MFNIKKPLIYIVEDDKAFSKLIESYLKSRGFWNIKTFSSGEECLKNIDPLPEIVVQDYDLTGMNGLEVLKKMKAVDDGIEFIFLSGQDSVQVAVDAMKFGAYDYIVKDSVAKEKIAYKIKRIIHLRKTEKDRKNTKIGMFIFLSAFVATWIILIILNIIGTIQF